MPLLAPESMVKKWYKKDGWVYRNFKYIFKNGLWNKEMPNGITVCPYFWMSILLGTFMRFLVPAILVSGFVAKKVGLLKLDRWVDRFFPENNGNRLPIGAGLLLAVCILSMVPVAIFLFGWAIPHGIVVTFLEYKIFLEEAGESIVPFIAALSSLIVSLCVLIPVLLYEHKHKYNRNKCNVGVYIYLLGVVVLTTGIIFAGNDLWMVFSETISAIGDLLSTAVNGIWMGIVWIFSWIVVFLSFCWKLIYGLFTSVALGFRVIPWILLAGLFFIYCGYILTLLEQRRELRRKEVPEPEIKGEEQDWTNHWLDYISDKADQKMEILHRIYTRRSGANRSHKMFKNHSSFISQFKVQRYTIVRIIREYYQDVFPDLVFKLKNINPCSVAFEGESRKDFYANFEREFLAPLLTFEIEGILCSEVEKSDTAKSEFFRVVRETEQAEEKAKQKESRAERNEERCKKFTGLFAPLGPPLKAVFFTLPVGIVKMTFKTVKFIFVTFWTIVCYFWMLGVASKKKACPYYPFEEGKKQ